MRLIFSLWKTKEPFASPIRMAASCLSGPPPCRQKATRSLLPTMGTRAIQIIQEEKVDLLIMEADMPEIKAYEAIPIIKGVDPTLPIIITADRNTSELEARIRQKPIFYYHVKSFGPEELQLAIRNALERQAKTSKGDHYGQRNPAD